jgi:alanyl-tRNA synthetase
MVIQGKESVFEIDSLAPLIRQVRAFSKPMQLVIRDLQPSRLESVLVDHLRALLFLVADGAPAPGKGGRARLVRILMREMLTCQRLLGISDPGFLRSMIWMAADLYPSVQRAEQRLLEIANIELDTFEHTIQAGMRDLHLLGGQIGSDEHLQKVRETRGLPIPLLKYQLWRQSSKGR